MKLLIVSLAAALLLLNCKKSRITPEAEIRTVVAKQPSTVLTDDNERFHLLYDEDGKLLVHTSTEAVHYYKPGNDHFLTQVQKTSNQKIVYKHVQRDAQNRIIKLEKFQDDLAESTMELSYNSEGFLSNRKIRSEETGFAQEFIYTYDEGNLVKIQEYKDAVLTSTVLMEYYNNRFNSLLIDLFDFKQIGFVTDGQFGKQSEKLVKSIKAVSQGQQPEIAFHYSYKTDANGYVRSMEIETNNETLKNYNFIFQ